MSKITPLYESRGRLTFLGERSNDVSVLLSMSVSVSHEHDETRVSVTVVVEPAFRRRQSTRFHGGRSRKVRKLFAPLLIFAHLSFGASWKRERRRRQGGMLRTGRAPANMRQTGFLTYEFSKRNDQHAGREAKVGGRQVSLARVR